MTVSRDGGLLGWTGKDGLATILDLKTGDRRVFQDHKRWVLALALSPGGTHLATAGDDGKVVVRDLRKPPVTQPIALDAVKRDIWSVALSPDSLRVAAASIGGKVQVWQLAENGDGPVARELTMPVDRRWKVSFSPDGNLLAVASWAGTVTFFNPADGRHLGTIDGHDQRVNDIVFVARTERIVTASNTGDVRIWNTAQVRPMFFNTPTGAPEIIDATYNWNGTLFLAGGNDGIARLYDVRPEGNLAQRCAVDADGWIRAVAFDRSQNRGIALKASDGKSSAPSIFAVFELDKCSPVEMKNLPLKENITSMAASPVSSLLVWGTGSGKIFAHNSVSHATEEVVALPDTAGITAMAFDPTGIRLLAGTAKGGVYAIEVGRRSMRELSGPTKYVSSVKFSANSQLMAAGGRDEKIFVWEAKNIESKPANSPRMPEGTNPGPSPQSLPPLKPVVTLKIADGTNYLAFSSDNQYLAAGSDGMYISMWHLPDWKRVFLIHKHVGIRSVYGFHPTRYDPAFDGSNGVIRVLPNHVSTGTEPHGMLDGIEPVFERTQPVVHAQESAQRQVFQASQCVRAPR